MAEGLPSLLEAMEAAGINTPARVAACFATLLTESRFEYNVLQGGSNVATGHNADGTKNFKGRGYIQLTGSGNYAAASDWLSRVTGTAVDLVNHPELAQSIEYSALIFRWYWTVARHCNAHADTYSMGLVNRDIGYPLTTYADGSTNDQRRCADFALVLKYLTGSVPDGITCTR